MLLILVDIPGLDAARAKYAWSVLCETAGLPFRFVGGREERLNVYYGSDSAPPATKLIVRPADWRRVLADVPAARAGSEQYPDLIWAAKHGEAGRRAFDPVAAVYWLMHDWERQDAVARDEHGRPIGQQSPLADLGILYDPLVNRYADRMRRAVLDAGIDAAAAPLWPDDKRCALVLTHDWDSPARWSPRDLFWSAAGMVRRPGAASLRRFAAVVGGLFSTRILRKKDPYMCLEDWADFERSVGARSAVYAGTYSRFEKGAAPNDVSYRIDAPHLAGPLKKLDRDGWEVGLHPSYNAWKDSGLFAMQKQRLEALLGHSIQGLRHHILRLDPAGAERTLALHEELGFEYDTSVIFNDSAGFRRGIATPYHAPGPDCWPPLALVELGQTIMDCQELRGADFQTARDRIQTVVERTVDVGGCVNLNWHVHSWHDDYPRYREVYRDLVTQLVGYDDVWVALPREVAAWWQARRRRLRLPPPPGEMSAGRTRGANPGQMPG